MSFIIVQDHTATNSSQIITANNDIFGGDYKLVLFELLQS